MIVSNFHAHTTHCDGLNTVDEMARSALARGMRALGFSGHGTTAYDPSYCMSPVGARRYIDDVLAARAAYAGKLEIYLGVEDDFFGERPTFPRDYTIGSVHTIRAAGWYYTVDHSEKCTLRAVREAFGGDHYALCAAYFALMAQVQTVTSCDFVGHFDLVTKFNEGGKLFDEDDPRFYGPALEAIEALCRQDAVFEINTGAMARGYRTAPYPGPRLLRAIREFGGAIVLSSDSHAADTVDFCLAQAAQLAIDCGFRSHRVLTPGGWQEQAL